MGRLVDFPKAPAIGFKEMFCLVSALLFLLGPLLFLVRPLALLLGALLFLVSRVDAV